MRMKPFLTLVPLLLSSAAAAQQAAPPPGVMVVSSQKCRMETMDELNRFHREVSGPILDALVREGKLTGWGVLAHAWGDEWNHVVYYTARDEPTFFRAFGELWRTLLRRRPDAVRTLAGWCMEHRDNIYSVVVTERGTPPR